MVPWMANNLQTPPPLNHSQEEREERRARGRGTGGGVYLTNLDNTVSRNFLGFIYIF